MAINIALGQPPGDAAPPGPRSGGGQVRDLPRRGRLLTRIPTDEDIAAVQKRFPQMQITVAVAVGNGLSGVAHQDSCRYIVGDIYLGAQDRGQLVEHYDQVLQMLPCEFTPVEDAGPNATAHAEKAG